MSLEELIIWLAQFGDPRLFKVTGGWYCCLDVFVTGQGVKFEIKSDFSNPTPRAAVEQCRERLQMAMGSLSVQQALGVAP